MISSARASPCSAHRTEENREENTFSEDGFERRVKPPASRPRPPPLHPHRPRPPVSSAPAHCCTSLLGPASPLAAGAIHPQFSGAMRLICQPLPPLGPRPPFQVSHEAFNAYNRTFPRSKATYWWSSRAQNSAPRTFLLTCRGACVMAQVCPVIFPKLEITGFCRLYKRVSHLGGPLSQVIAFHC